MTTPRVPPPRRRYAAQPTRGPRAQDTLSLVQHAGPIVLGSGVGVVWIVWLGWPLYTPVLTAAVAWMVTQVAVRVAAAVAGQYLGGTGATTPPRAEYSAARAMAAQGRYREAVDAYEVAAAESSGDPEPYLAAARILRDHMGDGEQAAAWFKRARRDARLTPGQELLVASELAELYTTKLDTPQRAIPELARIVQMAPDSPQGRAAAQRIAELRSEMGTDPPIR